MDQAEADRYHRRVAHAFVGKVDAADSLHKALLGCFEVIRKMNADRLISDRITPFLIEELTQVAEYVGYEMKRKDAG